MTISSIGGRQPSPVTGVPYAASKAAIIGLTKRLAREVGRHRRPGERGRPRLFLTGRLQAMYDAMPAAERDEVLDAIPLGRFPELREVVEPILFLASDEASLHHRRRSRRQRRPLHAALTSASRPRSALMLAQPEALELAGAGARQGVDELEHARVLVRRDLPLDEVLQLLAALAVVAVRRRRAARRTRLTTWPRSRRARRPRRTRPRRGGASSASSTSGPAML